MISVKCCFIFENYVMKIKKAVDKKELVSYTK